MQPTSTRRWPWLGSRPVVSVSRTISRMFCSLLQRARESPPPFWHCSNAGEDFTHLGAGVRETLRRIHHEIGAPPLFIIRHLVGHDGGELLLAHARPPEGALALHISRRRYHHHRVAALIGAGLEQQRDVEHRNRRAVAFRLGQEAL